jgi:hypothetical protein
MHTSNAETTPIRFMRRLLDEAKIAGAAPGVSLTWRQDTV